MSKSLDLDLKVDRITGLEETFGEQPGDKKASSGSKEGQTYWVLKKNAIGLISNFDSSLVIFIDITLFQ